MFSKYILIFLWLFRLSCADKSFTIVLDTTVSMREELDIIKVNLAAAISEASRDISEYIIVPFSDPDVGETTVTLTPRDLITAVNRMSVNGGGECPENSLAGIEKALQISKPLSNIFVFTDAYSRDINKLEAIKNLCRNTRSQVVIFLSGFCTKTSPMSVLVYYDVARACSGAVFRLDPFHLDHDLRQIFKYIKEVIKVEWTDVITYDKFSDQKELSFSVDSFTKSVLLAVSGQSPTVLISPVNNSSSTFENILETRHTQVIRLLEASPGEYKVSIRCHGTTSVVLYKKSQLPVRIGFSTEQPRSIRETSHRPLPGRNSYILIEVMNNFKLETIAMQVFNEQDKKTLELEETVNAELYLSKTFIEPDKSFRIWISGYDKVTYQNITGSTESLIPQVTVIDTRWMKPKAEILDESPLIVDFGKNTIVGCRAVGYPKPSMRWEDGNGISLTTPSDGMLLEMPSLYISYVQIDNVTSNCTLYCKCKNSEGEDSQSIEVYVHRPYTFEVLQTPKDQTIEYGSEGKLYCQVSAYPEAETKWYHNDSLVTQTDDVEIIAEENALFLKRMTLETVGEYKCEVSNEVETKTYTAEVSISGIEAPELEVEKSDIVLKLGDWTNLECRVIKGKPSPKISWKFKPKDGDEFDELPESVVMEEDKLKIASAQREHNGAFRCYATNIQGQHSADISVTVQRPPTISNSEPRTVLVKEGDDVALSCEVTASPAPTVYWEMSQDDVMMPFDDRHRTDDRYTHRFKALWKDSGNYHCIATNDIGSAEKSVTVNVLVKPYIEAPRFKTVAVRAGSYVTLMCNVIFGNPVPATKWEFIALDSTTSILKRGNSSSVLNLIDLRHADEGSYQCIAENDVGTDNIKIYVKVQ